MGRRTGAWEGAAVAAEGEARGLRKRAAAAEEGGKAAAAADAAAEGECREKDADEARRGERLDADATASFAC